MKPEATTSVVDLLAMKREPAPPPKAPTLAQVIEELGPEGVGTVLIVGGEILSLIGRTLLRATEKKPKEIPRRRRRKKRPRKKA